MMKLVSILLVLLAQTAWSQTCGVSSCCTTTTNNQDATNAAIISTPIANPPPGRKCSMQLCQNGNPTATTFTLPGRPTAAGMDGNISLVLNQYCQGFDNNLLGCTPDTWVPWNVQSTEWYYKGCPHCSASTCNNASSTLAYNNNNAGTRNPNHLRFVELPYAGKTCYMTKCLSSLCQDMNNVSTWAYARSSSFSVKNANQIYPQSGDSAAFQFPSLTDPWTTISRDVWNQIDYPNNYHCPPNKIFGTLSTWLCDVNAATYWNKARRWVYNAVAIPPVCEIRECAGNNAFPVIAKSTDLAPTGVVSADFQNFIRTNCATQIQGCYNTPTRWRWSGNSAHCSRTQFCSMVYCSCTIPFSNEYSTDVIMLSRPVLTSGSSWGYKVPTYQSRCIRAWCRLNGLLLGLAPVGVNNTVVETVYGMGNARACTAAAQNQIEYYNANGAATSTSSQNDVPATIRFGTSFGTVRHVSVPRLLCSALGYTFDASGQVTAGTTPTCYRSRMWATRQITTTRVAPAVPNYVTDIGSTNGLIYSNYRSPFNCDLQLSSMPSKWTWLTVSGAGCPSSSPTGAPTASCISNSISPQQGFYKYANLNKLDKQFTDIQCYRSLENVRMEKSCTQMSTSQLSDAGPGYNYINECYADRNAAYNVYQLGLYYTNVNNPVCRSLRTDFMSATTSPTFEVDLRMQNNECDWYRYQDFFNKIASCECTNQARIYSGGDAAYSWQMQKGFRDSVTQRLADFQVAGYNVLDDLSRLGCTYVFSCMAGSGTVTVQRPKFEAYYYVATMCKNVNWATLKSRIEGVMTRNGGTSSGVDINGIGYGRYGGVIMATQDAVDVMAGTIASCRVKWYTYFVNADMAKWFYGNLTATPGPGVVATPAFVKSTANSEGIEVISFSEDSPSSFRTKASFATRDIPSVALLIVLLMAMIG